MVAHAYDSTFPATVRFAAVVAVCPGLTVDAGFPTAWKQVEPYVKDLKAIILTHGHIDHCGFAPKAQKEAGVEDSPENMANYLAFEAGNIVRMDTIQRFAQASVHFQDWLEKYGARFGGHGTAISFALP